MKSTFCLLLLTFNLFASSVPEPYAQRLADAIYLAEGGAKTRYPYGVMSVKTKDPRRITLNSIRNNWQRWEQAGRPGEFTDWMADRWCPPSIDPVGNRNWKRNVKALLNLKPKERTMKF